MSFNLNRRNAMLTYVTLELEMDKIPEVKTPNNINVRKYNPERDAAIIVMIHNETMREFSDFSPLTEDYLKNMSTKCSFIAEIDGKPAGMVLCTVTDTKKGRLGYIAEFGVIKEYRRKGVGLALLGTILNCFKANKAEKITCEVLEENKLALHILKEKLRFKEVERTVMPPIGLRPL
ncbi:MAG: GNAT family N-acetyltransferase [Candidatus Jordarchaeaceae archaeon]